MTMEKTIGLPEQLLRLIAGCLLLLGIGGLALGYLCGEPSAPVSEDTRWASAPDVSPKLGQNVGLVVMVCAVGDVSPKLGQNPRHSSAGQPQNGIIRKTSRRMTPWWRDTSELSVVLYRSSGMAG
jgi:hypothetical protein